jgi:hypothetical protein
MMHLAVEAPHAQLVLQARALGVVQQVVNVIQAHTATATHVAAVRPAHSVMPRVPRTYQHVLIVITGLTRLVLGRLFAVTVQRANILPQRGHHHQQTVWIVGQVSTPPTKVLDLKVIAATVHRADMRSQMMVGVVLTTRPAVTRVAPATILP